MAVGNSASATPPFERVLIDDDAVIRATWVIAAKATGRRLLTLERSADFWIHAPHLDRSVPIYGDYSLRRYKFRPKQRRLVGVIFMSPSQA